MSQENRERNTRSFQGTWISSTELFDREPRNVFHRQLDKVSLSEDEKKNKHILFRKKFHIERTCQNAVMYITADDYYKLYINGIFVTQGPAPAYHNNYRYNVIDITPYLFISENTIAIHTYYQGLINRVWQSGDYRHGLLCDVEVDGVVIAKSDESFLCYEHTGYTGIGIISNKTQFSERYDERAPERDFYLPAFDDSAWEYAREKQFVDYQLTSQESKSLVFEEILPVTIQRRGEVLFVDFGKNYVGYFSAKAKGVAGDLIKLRFGQELNDDGTVRYQMRCNCVYADEWILSGEKDNLMQFDYKSFRYAEIECENTIDLWDICLLARHYPFELKTGLHQKYRGNVDAEKIWELCVHSIHYGVQEVIQDCMDREKGFYLGDGCYTALCHYILTKDDSMVRKLIDDAFSSSFISDGLVTCMDCSFMQEIAEYPLILISLLLWHYRLSGDLTYLRKNYKKAVTLMNAYKNSYEKNGLLQNLDRWCVVEWPANYRDGYAVDIVEGEICKEPHVAINAYYLNALNTMNTIAGILCEPMYRNVAPLLKTFKHAFYDENSGLFFDGTEHRHQSLAGNCFPYAFSLINDEKFDTSFILLLEQKGYDALFLFTTFPVLCGALRRNQSWLVEKILFDENTWKRMLREDATTTFEGWGKDAKWNTSLFHLTMSFAAIFLADIEHKKIFE